MILVTGGCSFSTNHPVLAPWPVQLEKILIKNDPTLVHYNVGWPGQGQGLISRRIIHRLLTLLETVDSKEILVGIMWSGPERYEIYTDQADITTSNPDMTANPFSFMTKSENIENCNGIWSSLTLKSTDIISEMYYKYFYSDISSRVRSLEHILRMQWFLKLHNIRYFMTTFMEYVLDKKLYDSNQLSYLYEQIDFSNFLPINGQYQWVIENANNPDRFTLLENGEKDMHPTEYHSIRFTEDIIIPFLQKKKYI